MADGIQTELAKKKEVEEQKEVEESKIAEPKEENSEEVSYNLKKMYDEKINFT